MKRHIDTISKKGNFEIIFDKIEDKIKEYKEDSDISRLKKLLLCCIEYDIYESLLIGIRNGDVWDRNEAIDSCLYMYHLVVQINNRIYMILMNSCAKPESEINDFISRNRDVFGDLYIEF